MNTADLDAFADQVNRYTGNPPPAAVSGSRDWTSQLLSPERAQRFELLMHLVANLGQPMVVCGPEGIGKTTFLGLLGERAFAGWRVVAVPTDSTPGFDDIIAHIAAQTGISTATSHAVAEFLQQQARNKGMLVLLLDEAGRLTPGIINALWQFARQYPALRLVMALRPDEAHLKTATDGVALGDCHFIDIPALTEPLCEVYLRRLATYPPRLLLPEEVTAARVHSLYQASHGVPGRILRILAQMPPRPGKTRRRRLVLALAVCTAIGVAVALGYYGYRSTATAPSAPASAASPTASDAKADPDPADTAAPLSPTVSAPAPVTAHPPAPLNDAASWLAAQKALDGWLAAEPQTGPQAEVASTPPPALPSQQTATAVPAPSIAATPAKPPPPLSLPAVATVPATSASPATPSTQLNVPATPAKAPNSPTPTVIEQLWRNMGNQAATPPPVATETILKPPAAANSAPSPGANPTDIPGLNGADWLLSQSPQSYTLRIMSARETASLKVLLERYPVMKGRLAAFKKRSGSGVWHQVYYGVFANESEARQAAAQLPPLLGKSKPVQLKWVQQEITRHP
ncbi:MAG: hypothetical protein EPN21_06075 [Methylococcaceae bacterium]|nr:MAG: hypothetical protein EPN21_06075 [Methylococcaceae bacterium]